MPFGDNDQKGLRHELLVNDNTLHRRYSKIREGLMSFFNNFFQYKSKVRLQPLFTSF